MVNRYSSTRNHIILICRKGITVECEHSRTSIGRIRAGIIRAENDNMLLGNITRAMQKKTSCQPIKFYSQAVINPAASFGFVPERL